MTILKILVLIFLPWTAYDLDLFRRQTKGHVLRFTDLSFVENPDEFRLKKQIQKLHSNVVPLRLRAGKSPARSKCSYYSIKSRDIRDSNQRKIRRKFNNM